MEEINRAIPRVVFEAKDSDGNDLVGVKVTMDGKVLTERLDGTAISLNPGEHKFVFESAQKPAIENRWSFAKGSATATSASSWEKPPRPHLRKPSGRCDGLSHARALSGSSARTVGLVVGGIGVAALATGAVFGLLANGAKNDYQSHCGANIGAPAGSAIKVDTTGATTPRARRPGPPCFSWAGGLRPRPASR